MPVNEAQLQNVIGSERPPEKEIRCGGCRRRPHENPRELERLRAELELETPTPEQCDGMIVLGETTYNPITKRYLCDECFVRAGRPTLFEERRIGNRRAAQRWICP